MSMATTNGKPRTPAKGKPTDPLDAPPRYDEAAEIGVLGSIVIDPKSADIVTQIITTADAFYLDAHKRLFRHLTSIVLEIDDGHPVDSTILANRLKSAGDWEAIGGAAGLSKIINGVPNAAHAKHYAEIVQKEYRRRQFREMAIQVIASDNRGEPVERIEEFVAAVIGLSLE